MKIIYNLDGEHYIPYNIELDSFIQIVYRKNRKGVNVILNEIEPNKYNRKIEFSRFRISYNISLGSLLYYLNNGNIFLLHNTKELYYELIRLYENGGTKLVFININRTIARDGIKFIDNFFDSYYSPNHYIIDYELDFVNAISVDNIIETGRY